MAERPASEGRRDGHRREGRGRPELPAAPDRRRRGGQRQAVPRCVPVPRLAARRRDAGAREPLAAHPGGRDRPAGPVHRTDRAPGANTSCRKGGARRCFAGPQDCSSPRSRSCSPRPAPRARIRSATSPSTTTPGSSWQATASTCATSSTWPRSRRSSSATTSVPPASPTTVARSLELRLDGRRVVLRPVAHRVVARRGAGGLKTLRFDAVFSAAASGRALTFADRVVPLEDRLAGDHDRGARRRAAPRRLRPERESLERAALVSRATCFARRSTSAPRSPRSSRAPLPLLLRISSPRPPRAIAAGASRR